MGSGASRTMTAEIEDRPLPDGLADKLSAALARVDGVDGEFKAARDDARFQQQVKDWGRISKEIDAHLRSIGNAIYKSHQVSIDIGSEGGGHSTRPFLEDLGRKLGRVDFRLIDGQVIARSSDGKDLGTCGMHDIQYEWLEQMAVEWLVHAASRKK